MNTFNAIPFPQGTPELLIQEALESLPLFHRLNKTNHCVLELDVIDHLLDLKEKLGNQVFNKLLKSHYPLTTKEITQKLGMAELKRNLEQTGLLNPTTLDYLLQIGTEGCAALAKGSEELAATLINQIFDVAGVTIGTLRALVRREKKGFNPLPSAEEIAIYQPSTLVTIIKPGRQKNWVAEVIETPDILGRVQVRLVKNNRKKTLFWWEVELHQLTTPDIEDELPPASLPQIIKQFVLQDTDGKYAPLSENDVESVREYAQTCAREDATEDSDTLAIKWKHLLEAVERYNLVPMESVLEIQESVTPASSESPASSSTPATQPNQQLVKEIAGARKQLVALQEEIDKCVEWETKGLLKQKQLHAQLRLDKALNALCDEVSVEESLEIQEPVEVEPAGEIIIKLETERNNLLHEINSLKSQLVSDSTGSYTVPPNKLDYQFEPITNLEELMAGDCIRISPPDRDLKFGDVIVEITEFGEVKTQWFGTLDNNDFKLGWKFEKVINPLQQLTVLPPPAPIAEEWKHLDGPLYEIVEMVDARAGEVRLEPVKGCKIIQHPTPSNGWYYFLSPTGQKISKPAIDGEWVKEQSSSYCELDF
ncbi:MAG TPA: hypothetical protein V6D13_01020 [Halomicronema sp.]